MSSSNRRQRQEQASLLKRSGAALQSCCASAARAIASCSRFATSSSPASINIIVSAQYHRERSGEPLDLGDYERFLRDIGYVLPEGNDFTIRTTNVDDEIAVVAGRQLVVPLSDARYALNAANARWG